MSRKSLSIIAVSVAVVAAAVAAVVVSVNRSNAAKAYAEAEVASADRASAEAKRVAKEAEIEAAKRRTAEANEKAKADELAAQKLAKETAELSAKEATDKRVTAEEVARAECAKADAARTAKEEARAKADQASLEQAKARELAETEKAKAVAEEAKLAVERVKSEKVIAEATLRKHEYDELLKWKQELDDREFEVEERERALKPEKTIADLSWAGGVEDTVIDDKGNVKKETKRKYDPENDVTLAVPTRALAKADRLNRERWAQYAVENRVAIVSALEGLYKCALKESRVVDADFYRKSILAMYPDWKFLGEKDPDAEQK